MAKTGIIHIHSDFSYDGQQSLEEIALFARKRGYCFVGMTEHSDTFNEDKMSFFVNECIRLSDPEFLMIPGIEFTCEKNLHLLGIGIDQFTRMKDPIRVAQFIQAYGGLSIVAHPSRYDYKLPSGLVTKLNGIEVWNAGYDGRFVPNDRSIKLLEVLRNQNRRLIPSGGQDLHQITDHTHVKITVSCNELTRGSLLHGLKEGNFFISNPYFRLNSHCHAGKIKLKSIIWARRAYIRAKAIRDHLVG